MAARRRRIRHSAPTRHVFDTGIRDRGMALPRWPGDTWGAALGFLRMTARPMTVQEEQAVSAVYTLISPGAHRPVGLTDEEWARLARVRTRGGRRHYTETCVLPASRRCAA